MSRRANGESSLTFGNKRHLATRLSCSLLHVSWAHQISKTGELTKSDLVPSRIENSSVISFVPPMQLELSAEYAERKRNHLPSETSALLCAHAVANQFSSLLLFEFKTNSLVLLFSFVEIIHIIRSHSEEEHDAPHYKPERERERASVFILLWLWHEMALSLRALYFKCTLILQMAFKKALYFKWTLKLIHINENNGSFAVSSHTRIDQKPHQK